MDDLREHPQIAELMETLEQNDMHKEKAEVESLLDYIGDMEKTLTEMLGEMQAMRQEINLIQQQFSARQMPEPCSENRGQDQTGSCSRRKGQGQSDPVRKERAQSL